MNKQLIRNLAITGGIYDCITDPYDALKNGDPYSSVMVDLERFAEKIVRECIKTIEYRAPGQMGKEGEGWTNGYDDGLKTGAWLLKKHFGLQEIHEQVKAGGDIHAGDGGYSSSTQERYEAAVRAREEAQPAPVQPVALPLRETEEMHDAVMSVIYQGVSRTNTDALWQAYRKVLTTNPPEVPTSDRVEISAPMRNVLHGALRRSGKVIHPAPWVSLTDDEIMDMYNEPRSDAEMIQFGRTLEARLKEKNK
jgi:hypothetical protein